MWSVAENVYLRFLSDAEEDWRRQGEWDTEMRAADGITTGRASLEALGAGDEQEGCSACSSCHSVGRTERLNWTERVPEDCATLPFNSWTFRSSSQCRIHRDFNPQRGRRRGRPRQSASLPAIFKIARIPEWKQWRQRIGALTGRIFCRPVWLYLLKTI